MTFYVTKTALRKGAKRHIASKVFSKSEAIDCVKNPHKHFLGLSFNQNYLIEAYDGQWNRLCCMEVRFK